MFKCPVLCAGGLTVISLAHFAVFSADVGQHHLSVCQCWTLAALRGSDLERKQGNSCLIIQYAEIKK